MAEESKILDSVVYQPDGNTCQAACIAKVLGTQDVWGVRQDLLELGTPGDPAVMGQYLKSRVKEYRYHPEGSLNYAIEALDRGYTIITHGWFTPSGHVITLVGWEHADPLMKYRFIVDDPWGEFDFPTATYDTQASGDNRHYSARGLYAYCVRSRSFDHAQLLYQGRQLDMNDGDAWFHLIKN